MPVAGRVARPGNESRAKLLRWMAFSRAGASAADERTGGPVDPDTGRSTGLWSGTEACRFSRTADGGIAVPRVESVICGIGAGVGRRRRVSGPISGGVAAGVGHRWRVSGTFRCGVEISILSASEAIGATLARAARSQEHHEADGPRQSTEARHLSGPPFGLVSAQTKRTRPTCGHS